MVADPIFPQSVQIEATVPDESTDQALRSVRPNLKSGEFFELGGNIEDLERPILLRVFKGLVEKANKTVYDRDQALIIAINSSKVVGLSTLDNYVLRRLLFGLGFNTFTKKPDGSFSPGLQQNPLLNKPGKESFGVGIFRDPKYQHISGVIYTSQSPLGFIPGGYSWHNSGIVFVPNPIATTPVIIQFPFFKKILCSEDSYREIDSDQEFISST